MRQLIFSVPILLLLCVGGARTYGQSPETPASEKDRLEARKVWDEVIKMKGGKERLAKVQNLLATWSYDGKTPDLIKLWVFPNKFWEWVGDTPRPRGTDPSPLMFLFNGDLKKSYSITDNLVLLHKNDEYRYEVDQNDFLLLDAPGAAYDPIRVTRSRYEKQAVDIVETRFRESRRVDFTIDAETYMVLKVSSFAEDTQKYPTPSEYVFKDYIDVDGIKMPASKGWLEWGRKNPKVETWVHYTFRFNVEYDPKFFVTIPIIRPAVDAWKPGAAIRGYQEFSEYDDWMRRSH